MSFLRKAGSLSLINIATAGVSLLWIPTLISFFGIENYGNFILATTIATIIYSALYVNSWQWLLIKIKEKNFLAANISAINDMFFTITIVILALAVDDINESMKLISNDYTPILKSYLIGFSLSHLSIYTAYYRSREQFTPPAYVALISEVIKASTIIIACNIDTTRIEAIDLLANVIWLFGIPHILVNLFCWIKLVPHHTQVRKKDILSYLQYNCYLHPKNMSDLLINHFDKIIININLGSGALAIYDLLKKLGYALSKILSPAYPVVFGSLVLLINDRQKLREKINSQTKYFVIASVLVYFAFEIFLFFAPALPFVKTVADAIENHELEVRLYVICHLLGFAFCSYHLILGVLGKTKKEFYLTTVVNLIFVSAFYLSTKHGLIYGIWTIFLQYSGLIIAKIWITKKII